MQVPACPEWTLSDLVQHLSGVHRRHVTGSSRGFGREFAQAALERDRAVARNTDSLADLPAAHGEAIRSSSPAASPPSGPGVPDLDARGAAAGTADRAAGPRLRRR
ncbi:hypothetical protein C3492_36945 [Streptomyces sp. Ru62]|nr:hypothetical protein C3492_36945 [Streptomyces sp. Ru62]